MSLQADCSGCLMGSHDDHRRDWNITPGLIGGNYCGCAGDCAERAAAAFDASPFGRALDTTLSPVSPAPVTNRAADEHDDRPGARNQREPGRSASTT